jgi:hypothetical protein
MLGTRETPTITMATMRVPQTGCRYRFTPNDWRFIIDSLGNSERGRQSLASLVEDPDSVKQIIDHPKLFEAVLMTGGAAMMSPNLFFFVVVRHTLKRVGVDDLEVADYLAVVCAEFGLRSGQSAHAGEQVLTSPYSIDYQVALNRASGSERFFLHVQCANQFMVLTCLYPSFLHRRAVRRGAPDVDYYEQVVVDHLRAAGRHALAEEFDLDTTLMRLSESFPPVRRAMNYTLREYLTLSD